MPQVGFEPMIPVFEWAKMVHALDCIATVIGSNITFKTLQILLSILLGWNIVYFGRHSQMFWRITLPPSSGSKCKPRKKQANNMRQAGPWSPPASCLSYSLTLKMEAGQSSSTSADFYQNTWLTTLMASTACYRDSFTYLLYLNVISFEK
jgi:hypothetical protein